MARGRHGGDRDHPGASGGRHPQAGRRRGGRRRSRSLGARRSADAAGFPSGAARGRIRGCADRPGSSTPTMRRCSRRPVIACDRSTGSERAFKITTPGDLERARHLLPRMPAHRLPRRTPASEGRSGERRAARRPRHRRARVRRRWRRCGSRVSNGRGSRRCPGTPTAMRSRTRSWMRCWVLPDSATSASTSAPRIRSTPAPMPRSSSRAPESCSLRRGLRDRQRLGAVPGQPSAVQRAPSGGRAGAVGGPRRGARVGHRDDHRRSRVPRSGRGDRGHGGRDRLLPTGLTQGHVSAAR